MTEATKIQKPLPLVDTVNKPFWDAAAQHVLKVQQCPSCERHQYPPLILCPTCSTELEWKNASGIGELHTFTVIRRVLNPAFAEDVPYNVAVVQLEEGPLVISNVLGIDNDELEIGMPLEVTFDDVAEGVSVPKFKPRQIAQ